MVRAAAPNPIFYVSSSRGTVRRAIEFPRAPGDPMGPLMLRDWDLNRAMAASDRHASHKGAIIREIIALHPTLPFILTVTAASRTRRSIARSRGVS